MSYAMDRPNIDYQPDYISDQDYCYSIFSELESYPFEQTEVTVYGRKYKPVRKICAFGDPEVSYSFSGTCLKPHPWTPLLLDLKTQLEKDTGYEYNYVLCNFYESGKAKIGQHKDSEHSLDTSVPIVTLSFGATRTMIFTKRLRKPVHQPLQNGSKLLMFDQLWSHAINAEASIKEPRISLTFRKICTIADLPMMHNQAALNELYIEERKPSVKRSHSSKNNTASKKKCVKSSITVEKLSVPTTASEPNLPHPESMPVVDILDTRPLASTSAHPYDPEGTLMKALDTWEAEYQILSSPVIKMEEKIPQSASENFLDDWNLLSDTLPPLSEETLAAWSDECDLILGEISEKPLPTENSLKEISEKICEIGRQEKIWLKSNTAIYIHCENGGLTVRIYEHERNPVVFEPTESGVCMDLKTYYDFSHKIMSISDSLSYLDENTIFGDNVLAVVQDKKLRLQSFTPTSIGRGFIYLDQKQLKYLKKAIHDIDGLVEHCLFNQLLKHLVSVEKPKTMQGKDPNMDYLRFLIEKDMIPKMNRLFYCHDCASQKYDLTLHDCAGKSISQKYLSLSHNVITLCDVYAVAKNFLEKHVKVFAGERDFNGISNNLFISSD